MDFASLMKSQIAASDVSSKDSGKKYLKRSEIEAQRQEAYARDQSEAERARLERIDKKRKRDDDEAARNAAREEKRRRLAEESKLRQAEEDEAEEVARRKRLGLPALVKQTSESLPEGEEDIEDEELQGKLKDMGEPRILFGEAHGQRLRRYRKLNELALAPKFSDGPIPTILELVPEKDMKVPSTVPSDLKGRALLHRQLASYFDLVLREWAVALNRRAPEVKASLSGRQALSNHQTAVSNLTPLIRKLETQPPTLHLDILKAVVEIVHLAQLKQYVKANDSYLRLSIGKAAWPIGVTMVGIHERSAREKLHETENEAHILADETTRKMLQGIKRCLSFAQTRWPPEDLGQLMG
ncbi:hypothetical protein B0A48_17712 [Cryoendolithus antarcticus]|uniref:Pre-mRNA-splicing factor 18 n=1 Tax=Cryoendolithus antarcticus TaxID=1507870 RepID=A0A1V8SAM6_9PEZI|nr:hypothetical protein B0A48_17712 [Cryoendolithus antarcticus]